MSSKLIWPIAAIFIALILATGGVLVARSYGHRAAVAAPAVVAARPTIVASPTATRTVIRRRVRVPVAVPVPNVTDPWAVVSAYYGDVKSHDYREAWALLSSGAVTGQTYRQFVGGYACTGAEQLTELAQYGRHVRFELRAVDDCTGETQYYTGTDTVVGGKIVAADITQTG